MSGKAEYLYINNLAGGINVTDSALGIKDNECQVGQNVVFTATPAWSVRDGYDRGSSDEKAGIVSQIKYYNGSNTEKLVAVRGATETTIWRYDISAGFTQITGGTAFSNTKVRFKVFKNFVFMWDESLVFKVYTFGGNLADVTYKSGGTAGDGGTYVTPGVGVKCLEISDGRMWIVYRDSPNIVRYTEEGAYGTTPSDATDGMLFSDLGFLPYIYQVNDQHGINTLISTPATDDLIIGRDGDWAVLLGVGTTDYQLRMMGSTAGFVSQDGAVEDGSGLYFVMGNDIIYLINGGNSDDITTSRVKKLLAETPLSNVFCEYDQARSLVNFYLPNKTLVLSVGRDEFGNIISLAWSTDSRVVTSAHRHRSPLDKNAYWFTLAGNDPRGTAQDHMYIAGGSADGYDYTPTPGSPKIPDPIIGTWESKIFDWNLFAETKQLRDFKSVQDAAVTTPFQVAVTTYENKKTIHGPFDMVLNESGTVYRKTGDAGGITYKLTGDADGIEYASSLKINGMMTFGNDTTCFQFSFKITFSTVTKLTVHKIAIEWKPKARRTDFGASA